MIDDFKQFKKKNINNTRKSEMILRLLENYELIALILLLENGTIKGSDKLPNGKDILTYLYYFVRNSKHNRDIFIEDIEYFLKLLLETGADVNTIDNEGFSVLMNSLYITDEAVVYCLEKDPDLSYKNDDTTEKIGDIFDYCVISEKESRFLNALKKIKPEEYHKYMKFKKTKDFNL